MKTSVTTASKTSVRWACVAMLLSLLAAACGSDEAVDLPAAAGAEAPGEEAAAAPATPQTEGCPTIKLVTYDSFLVSEGIFEAFAADSCVTVEQIAGGDTGAMVSAAILTKDNPTADVMFGIDNTFLQRGLDQGLFAPYASPLLSTVDAALQLDSQNRVTPVDFSDICVNYWKEALPDAEPATLDDLIDPANAGQFVTMNPETSAPGFAFLLATIATYGDGWEDYWEALADNGLSVTSGWSDAYYGEFTAGGGDRSIVTSYASSPPAEFIFADPPVDAPPTGVLYDSCFRSVEFAGVLAGTEYPASSQALIDFLLSATFQEDMPLNMFVYPANGDAALPDSFVEFGQLADDPITFTPEEIESNREAWTERWVEIVLG